MNSKLYRIEYQKNGQFFYSTYLRMVLADVIYCAENDVKKFTGATYKITEAIQ